MKKLLILLFIPFLIAAAPTRSKTYTSGETIKSSDVTENEDNIFNYLQSGVEVYSDGTIVNADVGGSANIQCSKLNLTACTQAITTTKAITSSVGIEATGLVASVSVQAEDYFAGDGTQGFTGSCASNTTLTVKDGLITECQ